jgi:Uncharacterised protein family (UPF0184)
VRLLVRESTAEGIQYWACDGCDVAWATRDGDGEDLKSMAGDRSSRKIPMSARAPLDQRRAIDDDLEARMDAAMARTRRLINSSKAIRATVRAQYGTPFTPRCASCQQSGRTHDSPPTSEQHYICASCQARWAVPYR